MRQNKRVDEGDNTAWMSTFSDLLMLMLTFFVLLLTMSSMDAKEVQQINGSGLQVFSGAEAKTYEVTPGMDLPKISPDPALALEKELLTAPFGALSKRYADVSETLLSDLGLQGKGWITRTPGGVEVNLDGRIAFEPGTPTLTPAARRFVEAFAKLLDPQRLDLSVVTHVAPGAGTLALRQDSLDLALLRADTLVHLLRSHKVPKAALSIVGFAHSAGAREGDFLRYQELLTLKVRIKPPDPPSR